MPTFTTPFYVRRVPIDPPLYAELKFGAAVLRIGGSWVETEFPTEDQIDAADIYLPGGYTHTVDDVTAAALTAAGYEVTP